MRLGYLGKAAIGLFVVVTVLIAALAMSAPKRESVRDLSLVVSRSPSIRVSLGSEANEVRLVVNYSNSSEILILTGLDNKSSISLSTKQGNEVWLPYGGIYYVVCTSCRDPVSVDIRAEFYGTRGSVGLLTLLLVIGLAGGAYSMINLINHFVNVSLKRRKGT
jgi:hypothetical protein